MKKIIEGVRYDTDKAKLIGGADNIAHGASSTTDFNYWEADLYKTKSGRFFLAGTGGPSSMFAHSVDQNSWSGGEKIIPFSKSEALEWAERHLDPDDVDEHFGDMIEDA